MNKIFLIGRLTDHPETKTIREDLVTTTFAVAVEREGTKDVDFLDVVTWRKTAENCARYLSKGSMVHVEGRVQKRSYENKEGKKVYVFEIIGDKVKFLNRVEKKAEQEEAGDDDFGF